MVRPSLQVIEAQYDIVAEELDPSQQVFRSNSIGGLDVVFDAVVKTARPATRLTPVDKNAYIPEAIFY